MFFYYLLYMKINVYYMANGPGTSVGGAAEGVVPNESPTLKTAAGVVEKVEKTIDNLKGEKEENKKGESTTFRSMEKI